jgi:hypothetical protein
LCHRQLVDASSPLLFPEHCLRSVEVEVEMEVEVEVEMEVEVEVVVVNVHESGYRQFNHYFHFATTCFSIV